MSLPARAALWVTICVLFGASLYAADKPITLALVMDTLSPAERAPLQAYLTKVMGRPVNLVAPDTYSTTVAGLGDGSYDFACLGALMYIRAHAKFGVIPLVQRATDLHYYSIFITSPGSPIYSLGDLLGREFAFGDIGSTSGHLMPYFELKKAGINPETDLKVRYSGSHPATAALVADGAVDAGAIDKTVFDFLIRIGKLDRRKVRVFYTSKPYIDYVYVARKDVPEAEQQKFARALLALKEGKDDPVLRILRAYKFVVAKDEEYANTRQIAHALNMF